MKTNSIMDFTKFKVEKTQLDKIIGAKKVEDSVYSGSGPDGAAICGIGNTGPNTYCCVQEFVNCYDDGSWDYTYIACD